MSLLVFCPSSPSMKSAPNLGASLSFLFHVLVCFLFFSFSFVPWALCQWFLAVLTRSRFAEEEQPPPSLVPRIHCLTMRQVPFPAPPVPMALARTLRTC